MRRLQRIAEPWNRTGLDCVKSKTALAIGRSATEPMKVRIVQLLLQVVGMIVASVGVGLPDFDHRIIDWRAVAIEHASHDNDPLAAGFAPRERFIWRSHQRRPEERTDSLRWSLLRNHFSSASEWRSGLATRSRNDIRAHAPE